MGDPIEPTDTGDLLAEAEAAGHLDPVPAEVTDPADPSYVEPAQDVTPVPSLADEQD